jgi:hypothetical protein
MSGGEANPELYFMHNGEKVGYLCYTQEWYRTCVMQNPLLKQKIEDEVLKLSKEKINKCLSNMEDALKNKGYNVKINGSKKMEINIMPEKLQFSADMQINLDRNDVKETINPEIFNTNLNSNSYELIMIASSIQNFEARYGDSQIDNYMALYPDIKVEKKRQSDGTKIYVLTERNTGEVLQFAVRSLAWPPGYALE